MAKSIDQIRNEISNFYLSIQNEITDVSVGSVAGGMIYALSSAVKGVYDQLDELEKQAFISTATGTYLDLLIEGGFGLRRIQSTRSVGYVVVYGDSPVSNPSSLGNSLICANYDYRSGSFISGLNSSTKFSGSNGVGSNNAVYSLIQPKNSSFYKVNSDGSINLDLRGKNAKYLILPVASVLTGPQVNLRQGALSTFLNPPIGLSGVSNVVNIADLIFNKSEISSSPLYSRTTTMLAYDASLNVFSVVNAFNFSRSGFLEISYRANFANNQIRSLYISEDGEEASGGLIFKYSDRSQTSVTLESPLSYTLIYSNGQLKEYKLSSFSYKRSGGSSVTYSVNSSDTWFSNSTVTLPSGDIISSTDGIVGSSRFFTRFFYNDPWVLTQKKDQIYQDIIFDPDEALSNSYQIKDNFRFSLARGFMGDFEYRNYFKNYINSLSKGTKSSLEFAAVNVPGVFFARSVDKEKSPTGSAILLVSDRDGNLPTSIKSNVINQIKDNWVSAGIELIVRPPDVVNSSVAVSIKISDPSFANSINQTITSSVSSYFLSKNPGDIINYGDVYSIISNVPGVIGIDNLTLGKQNDRHYEKFNTNYVITALERLTFYSPEEYSFSEDSVFYEPRNEVVIRSPSNQVLITPLSYSEYGNFLPSSNIFSITNSSDIVFAAVEGVFSSDAGALLSTDNLYTYTTKVYPEIQPFSSSNLLKVSFRVNESTIPVSVSTVPSSSTVISSDINTSRVVSFNVPISATDISITFSSTSQVNISNIQCFFHDDRIDSYLISDYESLANTSVTFLEKSRIKFIYGIESRSSRYRTLKLIRPSDIAYFDKLFNLMKSFCSANTLGVFKGIIRDYQYGTNSSGKNPSFYKNVFSDSENDFYYFFVYVTTSPFSSKFNLNYPITPSEAQAKNLFDYTLNSIEISRVYQGLINPSSGVIPYVGIEVL